MTKMLEKALEEWIELLGYERVLLAEAAQQRYSKSTLDQVTPHISAALFPQNTNEVASIVKTASRYYLSLYPISIGHNWGYGSASPSSDGTVILDLSRMKRIYGPDTDLGLITVEPGVTAGELEHFLSGRQIPFLPPLTGAGPTTSVLGNMLERGLSATVPTDRFASLTALEVVLPNGEMYRSPLVNDDEEMSNAHYKWGIGPYLDGLFAQSNFGVVTKATFALARKPEYSEVFFVVARKDDAAGELADASREVLQRLPGVVPALKIQGPGRTFMRLERYPKNLVSPGGTIDPQFINTYLRKQDLSQWIVFGTIQGPRRVVRAAHRTIRDLYHPHALRVSFFSTNVSLLLRIIRKIVPRGLRKHLLFMTMVRSYFRSIEGKQGFVSPKLPVWKKTGEIAASEMERFLEKDINYDLDPECGFIIFAAVIPMRKLNIISFLTTAQEVCRRHRIELLLNFSSFSDRSLFVSCPLLFNKSSVEETQRAHECYEELFHRMRSSGARLQRATVRHMHLAVEKDKIFWRVAQNIKKTLDPNDIVAPGRYASTKRK